MSDINFQDKDWLRLKEQYLKQIEEALVESGQPNVENIVEDVRGHLDRRFAELSPMQRTWENYQAIITEMGPSSEYAELAGQNTDTPKQKISLGFVLILAVALALLTVGLLVLPTLFPKSPVPTWTDKIQSAFINEPELIGKWASVDIVKEPNEFNPEKKQWRGELWLKDIEFNPDGTTSLGGISWKKGLIVENQSKISAKYEIKDINGTTYLFLPWLSGDVTIRHQKPVYYILKKVTGARQEEQSKNEQAKAAAIEAAEAWLQLVDDGQYRESWSQAAEYFKQVVNEEQWETTIKAVRKPLGKVLSRKVSNSTYTMTLPGAPDGKYVVIQFDTSFENKQNAVETVTPMMDTDGPDSAQGATPGRQWRVSGYYIK